MILSLPLNLLHFMVLLTSDKRGQSATSLILDTISLQVASDHMGLYGSHAIPLTHSKQIVSLFPHICHFET